MKPFQSIFILCTFSLVFNDKLCVHSFSLMKNIVGETRFSWEISRVQSVCDKCVKWIPFLLLIRFLPSTPPLIRASLAEFRNRRLITRKDIESPRVRESRNISQFSLL